MRYSGLAKLCLTQRNEAGILEDDLNFPSTIHLIWGLVKPKFKLSLRLLYI